MAPAPGPAAARRGRRAAIVASLLLSHAAVFGLGYSWHSLWGDYETAHSSLVATPSGGAAGGAGGGAALHARARAGGDGVGAAELAQAVADAEEESERRAREEEAAEEAEAREEEQAAGGAGDGTRPAPLLDGAAAAAKAAARREADARERADAVAAASAAAAAKSAPPTAVALRSAPAGGADVLGRVLELGTGGEETWLDKVTPLVVDNLVVYTWTNYHMRDFLLNFLLHLKLVRGRGAPGCACGRAWRRLRARRRLVG
jgi:hypothetical protein